MFVQRSPKGITSPRVFYENITGQVKGREGKIERSTKVHKELSDQRRRNTFTKLSVSEYICVREQVARWRDVKWGRARGSITRDGEKMLKRKRSQSDGSALGRRWRGREDVERRHGIWHAASWHFCRHLIAQIKFLPRRISRDRVGVIACSAIIDIVITL